MTDRRDIEHFDVGLLKANGTRLTLRRDVHANKLRPEV